MGRGLETQQETPPWRTSAASRRPATTTPAPSPPSRLQAKNVRIVPEETRSNDNAPSHRVYAGKAEIGAAWAKRSNEGRDYLGLKLDDPSFNAPIFANLFDDESADTYSLIWSRPKKSNGD